MSNPPSGEQILAMCGHRALDTLERTIDEATTRDAQRRSLLDGATPIDKKVLSSLYASATLAGLVVSGLSVYPFYRLSQRTRPVVSVLAGTLTGIIAGITVGFRGIGDAVVEIAAQPTRSSIADKILCPTLNEFGPCERDERCRAIVLGSGYKGATLLECAALCQERVCVPLSAPTELTTTVSFVMLRLLRIRLDDGNRQRRPRERRPASRPMMPRAARAATLPTFRYWSRCPRPRRTHTSRAASKSHRTPKSGEVEAHGGTG